MIPFGYYVEFYVATAVWVLLAVFCSSLYFQSGSEFKRSTKLLRDACFVKIIVILATYPDWLVDTDPYGRAHVC